MSVLALKEYMRSTIAAAQAAIIANTTFTSVTVFRQVPKFEKLGTGFFVVLGPFDREEERLSVPRGGGQKRLTYEMQVWVMATAADEQAGGDSFDTASENLSQVLRTANVVIDIVDPVTGGTSWLLEIAEVISERGDEPELAAPQGLVRFFTEKRVKAIEVLNNT